MPLWDSGRRVVGRGRKKVRAQQTRRLRPLLETLERRLVLATFSVNAGDVTNIGSGGTGGLVWAINQANQAGGSNTIELAAGSTYNLSAADNNWYGPNGLPPITSDLTIDGNGATIERSAAAGTPDFRLFYVSGGEELVAGSLDLENITLANGIARGGAGGAGGGGGMGAGGAIFNQGALVLSGVTLTNNEALGGTAAGSGEGGGGGIGSDQKGTSGGGFGGSFSATFGGQGGAGDSSGAGGGGGGFLSGANGASASANNGGAGAGLGGFGGTGGGG
ncbi:MAG TPA: hypothetical protein VFI31_02320, partial [Pirellulales bacterium]|nr:hypothetical protein [Pirellulales bacterium]